MSDEVFQLLIVHRSLEMIHNNQLLFEGIEGVHGILHIVDPNINQEMTLNDSAGTEPPSQQIERPNVV